VFTGAEILQDINESLDFTMTSMDIARELQKILDKFKGNITNGMSENEKKAYDLGVENSVEGLKQILESESFIFDLDTEIPKEYDLGTIIQVMKDTEW